MDNMNCSFKGLQQDLTNSGHPAKSSNDAEHPGQSSLDSGKSCAQNIGHGFTTKKYTEWRRARYLKLCAERQQQGSKKRKASQEFIQNNSENRQENHESRNWQEKGSELMEDQSMSGMLQRDSNVHLEISQNAVNSQSASCVHLENQLCAGSSHAHLENQQDARNLQMASFVHLESQQVAGSLIGASCIHVASQQGDGSSHGELYAHLNYCQVAEMSQKLSYRYLENTQVAEISQKLPYSHLKKTQVAEMSRGALYYMHLEKPHVFNTLYWPSSELQVAETSQASLLLCNHMMSLESCFPQPVRVKPLNIVRACSQYLYDDQGLRYLDCVNSTAHVGHGHPHVSISETQLVSQEPHSYLDSNLVVPSYPTELLKTLPEPLDTILFCNSETEAVNLAMQMCCLHTQAMDIVMVANSLYGLSDSVQILSEDIVTCNTTAKPGWVHLATTPDLYRGPYREDDLAAIDKYIMDFCSSIDSITRDGRKIAGFICEPILSVAGCIFPDKKWLQHVYRKVREAGGLCIADEIQTGLGRLGSHWWSFEAQDVYPDIIIIGKGIGNGYPMAGVITTSLLADGLGEQKKKYQCTSVMDNIGCSVLQVISMESLMHSAAEVGATLKSHLDRLKLKHEYIGDVRGSGLIIGIEIVWNKESRKPSMEIANHIVHQMREDQVIITSEGTHRNVLILTPPMSFSKDNVRTLVNKLDKVLTEIFSKSPTLHDGNHVTGLPFIDTVPLPEVYTNDGQIGGFQHHQDSTSTLEASCQKHIALQLHRPYHDID